MCGMRLKDLVMEDFQKNQIDEVRSPLRWVGGKFFIADWIISLMPRHEIYVEPFFGAGWVFFKKSKVKVEVINDIDDRIYALFKVLSDEELFQKFLEKIWFVGKSEKLYYEMLGRSKSDNLDLVDKAVAFFYVNKFCIAGNLREAFLLCKDGFKTVAYEGVKKRLLAIHRRLENVLVLNRDWKEIVEKYDGENVVHYLDPPYVISSRPGSEGIYAHEMSDEEHEELVDICLRLKGRVILSGYRNRIYERLERNGWIRLDKKVKLYCQVVCGASREERIESVWLNYKPNCLKQESLFYI
jgi:DNA adenine methylase